MSAIAQSHPASRPAPITAATMLLALLGAVEGGAVYIATLVLLIRPTLRRAFALSSVVVLLTASAVGASSPAADSTIHDCYAMNGGGSRIIDASGAACTTNFKLVPPDLVPFLRLGQLPGGGDDGGGENAAVAGAGRRAVEHGIRTDRGLSTQDRSLLMAWLNGDSLLDPRLVWWVNAATMGYPVEGAGPMVPGLAGGAGRRAVEYGIRTDRGLSAQDRSLLMAWLNGDLLADPRLVVWVNAATMGHLVEGAGAMAQGSAAPLRP